MQVESLLESQLLTGRLQRIFMETVRVTPPEVRQYYLDKNQKLVLGVLGQVSTYGYSDQVCGLGTAGTASFASAPGSLFYLVVANDGTTEGSYGQDSEGVERPGQNPQPSCSFEHLPGLACE